MDEYFLFEAFERGDYINEEDVPNVIKYICGHLNSWSPNRSYFERQCNYTNKLLIVLNGSENMGCLFALKNEKQYANKNLLTFLKKNNIKIVIARQFEIKKIFLGNSYGEMIRQFLLY